MLLSSGATFAGYTIVRQLDRGAMGEVYLAEHSQLARRDALRVFPAALTADAGFRERFIRDAEAASVLSHPHIVELHDYGEFNGRLWIATDYVDGVNADRLIADRFQAGMSPQQALAIVAAVADALDYAHRRGLLHRYVRPANILLTGSRRGHQRIMLADFGVARSGGLGAVAYAAPEELIGTTIDGRADQYALASTAFQLLTGAPPFTAGDPVDTFRKKPTSPPPTLSDRSAELARLDEVMSAALAVDPADRFDSCRDFADALSKQAGGTMVQPIALVGAPRRTARHPRWRWIALGSAIGAAAAAALVAVGVAHRHDDGTATGAATTPDRPNVPAQTSLPPSSRPAAAPQLDGTYRVDTNRSRQTYNDIANPQPPDVTTWWAFRSACPPAGCVAAGVMLDDSRQVAAAAGNELRLDFVDGQWKSRPLSAHFPCVDATGRPGMQTTTEVLWLHPRDGGLLRGELAITVETNECGQQGAVIRVPTAAVRTADLPSAVGVPDPVKPITTAPTR